jgi:hypothetical protein
MCAQHPDDELGVEAFHVVQAQADRRGVGIGGHHLVDPRLVGEQVLHPGDVTQRPGHLPGRADAVVAGPALGDAPQLGPVEVEHPVHVEATVGQVHVAGGEHSELVGVAVITPSRRLALSSLGSTETGNR